MTETYPIEFSQDRIAVGGKLPVRRVVRVVPENTALLHVDLNGKHDWELFGVGYDNGIPNVGVHPKIDDDEHYDHEQIVTIGFHEFAGWSIWAVELNKDYIAVTLYLRETK